MGNGPGLENIGKTGGVVYRDKIPGAVFVAGQGTRRKDDGDIVGSKYDELRTESRQHFLLDHGIGGTGAVPFRQIQKVFRNILRGAGKEVRRGDVCPGLPVKGGAKIHAHAQLPVERQHELRAEIHDPLTGGGGGGVLTDPKGGERFGSLLVLRPDFFQLRLEVVEGALLVIILPDNGLGGFAEVVEALQVCHIVVFRAAGGVLPEQLGAVPQAVGGAKHTGFPGVQNRAV